jgi:hypothetical protein
MPQSTAGLPSNHQNPLQYCDHSRNVSPDASCLLYCMRNDFMKPELVTLAAASLLFGFAAQPKAQDYNPCPRSNAVSAYEFGQGYISNLTPGVSWVAWSELLNDRWSDESITRRISFEAATVEQAMRRIGFDETLPESYYNDFQNYMPPLPPPDPNQATAYETAAKMYRAGDWDGSITLFDEIVADGRSLYRGAAAYSAARAALKTGQYVDALHRIDAILRDPSLVEFHLAASHLLGTMAWRTGTAVLVAGRLAEISHLLVAPAALVCSDPVLQRLQADARQDLKWYLGSAYPAEYANGVDWARRLALDRLAAMDPLIDLARVLAAPTPFDRDFGWIEPTQEPPAQGDWEIHALVAWQFARQDRDALTNHARERWLATRNPLWGFALAKRTSDPLDIARLRDMIQSLDSLPQSPAVQAAIPALRWEFRQHLVRLLLMNDRFPEAVEVLHSDSNTDYRFWRTKSAIVDGGVRFFLARFDLADARGWASAASEAMNQPVSGQLVPILADEPGGTGLDDGASPYGAQESLRAVLDMMPASRLVALANSSSLSLNDRRAVFAAGWLRLYLLGNWQETKGLLPQLRSLYPELAADIDAINSAWFDDTRQHLVLRMLLRSPGLSPRAFWARDLPSTTRYGDRTLSLFAIDSANPSDGNWWCPMDIDQMKIDLARSFYIRPLNARSYADPRSGQVTYLQDYWAAWWEDRAAELKLADWLIAWHPALKGIDLSELNALAKVESGPKLLTEGALRWGNDTNWFWHLFGTDDFLPETLHLAVRSTRYGCRRAGGHALYSKSAFIWLRQNYPDSDWTLQTPYWFDRPGIGWPQSTPP